MTSLTTGICRFVIVDSDCQQSSLILDYSDMDEQQIPFRRFISSNSCAYCNVKPWQWFSYTNTSLYTNMHKFTFIYRTLRQNVYTNSLQTSLPIK